MTALYSIDPGTHALGIAFWSCGRVIAADHSKAPPEIRDPDDLARFHARGWGRIEGRAVLERMESAGGRRATTTNDLLNVQAVGCLVAARLAPTVVMLRPSEWKANLAKDMHHERFLSVLTPGERTIVDQATARAGRTHAKEVLDAVGIGLYYLQRINRSGGPRR